MVEHQVCAVDDHDLVCGCGDTYPHPHDGSHAGTIFGCCICHAGPDELSDQWLQANIDAEVAQIEAQAMAAAPTVRSAHDGGQ